MSAAQNDNRLDSGVYGSGRSGWAVGLAIVSSLLVPTVSHAQMQALPPPPSAPNTFPQPDGNMAPLPPMAQPMPGFSGGSPASVYPMPMQGSPGYGGLYQVIVYGASPYLLRQIKFLEPNAVMQTYQGRPVIVAGTFDNPAAAQQRVLTLAGYGVGAQAISASMGATGQQVSGVPFPMTNAMAAPTGNAMNTSLVVPTTDTPPNLFPNAYGTAPSPAIAPTGMPMNSFPGASVTAPMAVAPTGMPTNSWPDASVNAPMAVAQSGMPINSMPNAAPMDGSMVAPPPGMPMNSYPPNMPMNAPMGSPPLGTATMTPPTTAMPGNVNPAARYEVVIPARTEDFNAIANRLMGMGVRPDAIQGREKPRGPHISVGPYLQAREAEAISRILQAGGMNARVFYTR